MPSSTDESLDPKGAPALDDAKDPEEVLVALLNMENDEILFRVRPDENVWRIVMKYAEFSNVDLEGLLASFEGVLIDETSTVRSLGIKNYDRILVFRRFEVKEISAETQRVIQDRPARPAV